MEHLHGKRIEQVLGGAYILVIELDDGTKIKVEAKDGGLLELREETVVPTGE